MAPPQLARDAPVLDVVEPLVVGGAPVFRHELDFAIGDLVQRRLGDRLAREESAFRGRLAHGDEPLVRQHRLDDDARAVAARHHQFMRLDLLQQALRVEVGDDLLARGEAVHAAIGGRRVVRDLRVQGQDDDLRQFVALAHGVIVHVVRRGDLHAARAEFLVDVFVGDDGDFAVRQGQLEHLAHQRRVALVRRIDGHGHVAQHGFRTGGGHRQETAAVGQRVFDVPHGAVFFLGHHFQVGHRRAQHGVPVDEALAAVDQALFEQAHEDVGDDFRARLIHREVFALPVGRGAQAAHLAGDDGTGFFFPFPHFFHEFLAAQVMARNLLRVQLALHDDLRGDARVVGAGNPGRVVAQHAVVAGQAIHDGLVERMAHVQGAGDVRRRQLDAEGRFSRIEGGAKVTALLPLGAPELFNVGGLERLG